MPLTSEEFAMLYEGTERFIRDELRPLEEQLEREDGLPDDVWAKLADTSQTLGLYNANIPEEYGGTGLSMLEVVKLGELFGQTSWPFTYIYAKPNALLLRGTKAQQEEYLRPVMDGQKVQCFALTEPDAGSYTSGLKTRAVKVEGGWKINGAKSFITNGQLADFAIVIAVSSRSEGKRPEATAFIVDKDRPGYNVGSRQEGIGFRGVQQRELYFEDCFVPDDKVLGELGQGLNMGFEFLAERRLFLSAYCTGVMDRLIGLCVPYMASRQVQGGALIEKQGIRWKLAQMEADHFAVQSVVYAAAEQAHQVLREGMDEDGPKVSMKEAVKNVSIAKWLSTTGVNRSADTAVQIHGGSGWSKGNPVERIYRDVRATRIMDGTDEIHQEIIAREVVRSRS